MYSGLGQVDLLAQQAQADQDAAVQRALDTMYLITGAAPPPSAAATTETPYTLPEVTTTVKQTPWLILGVLGFLALASKSGGSQLWK